MKAVVVDASFAISLFLKDEFTPAAVRAVAVFRQAERRLVPAHFLIEIANGLLMAERRNRATRGEINEALRNVMTLPVDIDSETTARCTSNTFDLARTYNLKLYDAIYLELAIRESAVLATNDRALAHAADLAGIKLMS